MKSDRIILSPTDIYQERVRIMITIDALSIKQLRYFLVVAEAGSFRRAADRIDVTQPSLTAQIANLETSLGLFLFERSRTGVKITPYGRELLIQARRILEEVQSFCNQASSLTGEGTSTYRIGVTPTVGPYLLPIILPKIHADNANLKLYVREGVPRDLENELKEGGHDLILTTLPLTSRELVVAPLFREPLKLAIAQEHPLATKEVITADDLNGEEVLTIGENFLFNRQISQLCDRLGASIRREYEGTSLDTLRHMVVMGMGLAFLPALYVRSEIRDDSVIRVTDVQGINEFRVHALAWRPNSPDRGLYKNLAEQMKTTIGAFSADVTVTDQRAI